MSAYFLILVQVIGLSFPGIGVWTIQRKGARGLRMLLLGYVAVIVILALMLASPAFGNRQASEVGYWTMASRLVSIMVITLAVPIGLESLVILATGGWRTPARIAVAYGVFLVTTILAFIVVYWWHYAM